MKILETEKDKIGEVSLVITRSGERRQLRWGNIVGQKLI